MKTILIALAGAATILSAVPAEARHHKSSTVCVQYRHGHCVAWQKMSRAKAHRYAIGHRFGPSYGYTTYSSLPQSYRSRYNLNPDYRYVYSGNTIYVVDPKTYAIQRVIDAIIR